LFKRRHAFRSESIERFIKQIVISEMSNAWYVRHKTFAKIKSGYSEEKK
jgi:hypothetical protein